MFAQFVLLMWGAELLSDGLLSSVRIKFIPVITRNRRALIVATLVLGLAGSIYELLKVRFVALASDMGATVPMAWLTPDRNLGARTYALRQLYEDLKQRTPSKAVFQHNPNINPDDPFHGMYADRQLAAESLTCGVVFGGDAALCVNMIGKIDAIFENPAASNATRIDDICAEFGINVLVVKDTDPVWKDRDSWVWKREPMLANDYGRAFDCRPSPQRR